MRTLADTIWQTTWGSREGADSNDTDRMVYAPSHRFAPSGVMVHASTSSMRELPMDNMWDEKFAEKMVLAMRPQHSQSGSNVNMNISICRVKNTATLLPLHHGGCSREYKASWPPRFTSQVAILT